MMATSDERIDRLERELARWRRGAAVAIVAGVGLVVGGASPGADTVAARRFVVQDVSGRPRAILGLDAKGLPGLALLGSTGAVKANLSLPPEGGVLLDLGHPDSEQHATMAILPDGEVSLELTNGARIGLVMRTDAGCELTLRDVEGRLRGGIGIDAKGQPVKLPRP
jgi:hypothetical protein